MACRLCERYSSSPRGFGGEVGRSGNRSRARGGMGEKFFLAALLGSQKLTAKVIYALIGVDRQKTSAGLLASEVSTLLTGLQPTGCPSPHPLVVRCTRPRGLATSRERIREYLCCCLPQNSVTPRMAGSQRSSEDGARVRRA